MGPWIRVCPHWAWGHQSCPHVPLPLGQWSYPSLLGPSSWSPHSSCRTMPCCAGRLPIWGRRRWRSEEVSPSPWRHQSGVTGISGTYGMSGTPCGQGWTICSGPRPTGLSVFPMIMGNADWLLECPPCMEMANSTIGMYIMHGNCWWYCWDTHHVSSCNDARVGQAMTTFPSVPL